MKPIIKRFFGKILLNRSLREHSM